MDVQQSLLPWMGRKRDFWKIDGAERRAIVAVANELARDLYTNVTLRFGRAAADMRRQQDIVPAPEGRTELFGRARRFGREHVERRAGDVAGGQRGIERVDVDDLSAR